MAYAEEKFPVSQLPDRYVNDGALGHIRSADDVTHHLNYWKSRLGGYALIYLTPELQK